MEEYSNDKLQRQMNEIVTDLRAILWTMFYSPINNIVSNWFEYYGRRFIQYIKYQSDIYVHQLE